MNMKRIIPFILMLCSSIISFAQATSLEVDCQNPGWLSNKINYQDQTTVQNLRVTGYINSDDLKFIGQLIAKSLTGTIDLEDAYIVGSSAEYDNTLPKNCFDVSSDTIDCIKFPKQLVSATACLYGLRVNTVVIGGDNMPVITPNQLYEMEFASGDGISFNSRIRHLVLRDGVTEIAERSFYNEQYGTHGTSKEKCRFESVEFPSTLTKIGENAFRNCYALDSLSLPSNIEEIGAFAFAYTAYTPDTLFVPENMKNFNMSSFNRPKSKVYYIGKNIENITNYVYNQTNWQDIITPSDNMVFHIAAETPPTFGTGNYTTALQSSVVYVPKSSVPRYQGAANTVWAYTTILAEPTSVASISLNYPSYEMGKATTLQLVATILPDDADNQKVTWSTTNDSIVTVDSKGLVTAVAEGNATITASSSENPNIKAECTITVLPAVSGVSLNLTEYTFSSIGESVQLTATVEPENAANKNVTWKSSNESVCVVSPQGKVVAVGYGSAAIIATTVDGGYISACSIKVAEPVETPEDVNRDGKVNATDAMLIYNYILSH